MFLFQKGQLLDNNYSGGIEVIFDEYILFMCARKWNKYTLNVTSLPTHLNS